LYIEPPESNRDTDDGHEQLVTQGNEGFRHSDEGRVFVRAAIEPIVLSSSVEIAQGADPEDVRHRVSRSYHPFVVEAVRQPHWQLEKGMSEGTEVRGRVGREQTAVLEKPVEGDPNARQHGRPRFLEMPIDM